MFSWLQGCNSSSPAFSDDVAPLQGAVGASASLTRPELPLTPPLFLTEAGQDGAGPWDKPSTHTSSADSSNVIRHNGKWPQATAA